MTVKTLFSPETGRLFGAQIVGFEGVDKRIDVLAAAVRMGMTGEALAELELSYAPPYSSAKDPVNMAGYVMRTSVPALCGNTIGTMLRPCRATAASSCSIRAPRRSTKRAYRGGGQPPAR